MKKMNWKKFGFMLAILALMMGNLIGIRAWGNEEGDSTIVTDKVPDGLLVGYTPSVAKQKKGEHFEYYGWIGAPFSRLVIDYDYYICCLKTNRAMDGCMNLKICPN